MAYVFSLLDQRIQKEGKNLAIQRIIECSILAVTVIVAKIYQTSHEVAMFHVSIYKQ